MNRKLALPFVLLLLTACVRLDTLPPGMANPSQTGGSMSFPDVDSNGALKSLHFSVHGYLDADMQSVSQRAESIYNKIGNDTGLYSYMAGNNYTIVLYRDADEYLRKTNQQAGSKITSSSSTIYMYPDPDNAAQLAHQLCHMVLQPYFGDSAQNLRWIVEGIAMMEEYPNMQNADQNLYLQSKQDHLRLNPIPFSQMTFANPVNEDGRRTDPWFQQVDSVVSFLVQQGPGSTFGNFLNELRTSGDANRALQDNYASKFHNMTDLETAWRSTI